jgi:hypothetical protein
MHQARDDLQKRALAAAARSQDAQELVTKNGQVQMVKRVIPARLAFVEMVNVDRLDNRGCRPGVA